MYVCKYNMCMYVNIYIYKYYMYLCVLFVCMYIYIFYMYVCVLKLYVCMSKKESM